MTDLERLIEKARAYREEYGFSEDEKDQQIRSFAYGNTHLENDSITKTDIDDAAKALLSV